MCAHAGRCERLWSGGSLHVDTSGARRDEAAVPEPNGLRARVDRGPQFRLALTGSLFGDPQSERLSVVEARQHMSPMSGGVSCGARASIG